MRKVVFYKAFICILFFTQISFADNEGSLILQNYNTFSNWIKDHASFECDLDKNAQINMELYIP